MLGKFIIVLALVSVPANAGLLNDVQSSLSKYICNFEIGPSLFSTACISLKVCATNKGNSTVSESFYGCYDKADESGMLAKKIFTTCQDKAFEKQLNTEGNIAYLCAPTTIASKVPIYVSCINEEFKNANATEEMKNKAVCLVNTCQGSAVGLKAKSEC